MELNNVFKLRDIIELGGGQIIGRKKIQKMVYIMQELTEPFDPPFRFKWNYYGVYSEELTGELGLGEFFGIIKEKQIAGYRYRTFAIEAADDSNPTGLKNDQKIKELVSFLNRQEPRLLEVLSSIIFFEKECSTDEEVQAKLIEHKGHLKDAFADAASTYARIKNMTKHRKPWGQSLWSVKQEEYGEKY